MDIHDTLKQLIISGLRDLNVDKAFGDDLYLDLPTDIRFGDLTTNIALKLAKVLKKSPPEIAGNLIVLMKRYLEDNPLKDYVREIKVEGAGFINFYLSDNYFYTQLKSFLEKGEDFFRSGVGKNKRVLIEFVSANPTGPLSVAHARQAAVGDILANTLSFLGFEVKREYYLNDEGNQINILGDSVNLRLKEISGEKIDFPQNYYRGKYIYDIARIVQSSKFKVQSLGDYAAEYILNIIKKELADFGVRFDFWASQKALRKSGDIEKTLGLLRQGNFLYELDGALWFKSSELGDDKDRVVIKSDGSYTYLAPDIAYHEEKYRRGFNWLINLWGPDHHGYINRLKAAVSALGHDPKSLSIIIVQLASIFRQGKPIQMSTRTGEYITLREVLDEVGSDAARFFFIMRRTSSHLDFDLDVAKKQTSENPVYYVQYAYARICSILRSAKAQINRDAEFNLLKEKEEIILLKKILQFSVVLEICLKTEDPYMLTVYLQEVSECFHKFYDQHRVLGQDQGLTQARLALIEGARVVIAKGLDLIGVSKPEKM